MSDNIRKGLLILGILMLAVPLYAQRDAEVVGVANPSTNTKTQLLSDNSVTEAKPTLRLEKVNEELTFSDWINEKPYYIRLDKKEERKKIREAWKRFFGIDLFLPYFKANEMKEKVENKTTIKILKLKGKAELSEDQAKFIFRLKF